MLAPNGANITTAPIPRRIDNAMVKAIARAFRWRELLENGTHATIAEIAAAEKVNESYIGRVLRLTLLAPDVIEAVLNGRQAATYAIAEPAAAVSIGLEEPTEDLSNLRVAHQMLRDLDSESEINCTGRATMEWRCIGDSLHFQSAQNNIRY